MQETINMKAIQESHLFKKSQANRLTNKNSNLERKEKIMAVLYARSRQL